MSPAAVVLDNEAVQALLDPGHAKHRRITAILAETNHRDLRRGGRTAVVVPTAVRVEAGWDRTDPASATANRIARARDRALDTAAADRATLLRSDAGVSVVDACVAQAAEEAPRPVVVVTSDVGDMERLAGFVVGSGDVRVLAI